MKEVQSQLFDSRCAPSSKWFGILADESKRGRQLQAAGTAASLDEPESLLSGTPIEIADIPNDEPACQFRAPIPDIGSRRSLIRKRTFALCRISVRSFEIGDIVAGA